MAETARPHFCAERTPLGGASALVATIALVVTGGLQGSTGILQGVVGAAVVAIAWYLSAPTYAFALGNIALVSILPEAAVGQLLVVEVALLGMLLASATTLNDPDRPAYLAPTVGLIFLALTLAGGGLAWASAQEIIGLEAAGGLLVGLTATAAYGLHRYQLVALGVADESATGAAETAGGVNESTAGGGSDE